ncbi:MauE/DoxX family redox-associated membrane protein [Streptomyces indonesiensis]
MFGRGTARQASRTALARLLRDGGRAALALRTLGAVELLLAAALLAPPVTPLPGAAAALLGAGFLGYLGYARAAAPGSSCGCTARPDTPSPGAPSPAPPRSSRAGPRRPWPSSPGGPRRPAVRPRRCAWSWPRRRP